ncbi:MAG: Ig domain-containing protein [Lachnospiraceae bacterium]|nr:Ig domain-containing protein [Lachnospiraceae bacterium]
MKKLKRKLKIMLLFLLLGASVWSVNNAQTIQADSVGSGAKIVTTEEPDRVRFHIGRLVGTTDQIKAVPTKDAALTDVTFTSSNTAVCSLTKHNDYWEIERLKEGISVITMTCKADGEYVKRTLLVSSFTRVGGSTEVKGIIQKGATVYYGASDEENISSDDSEVKEEITKNKNVIVKYQCNDFYRVELEEGTFGESDEEWGFVKKNQVQIPVTGVSVKKEVTIFEKEKVSLGAKTEPEIASNPKLKYRCSNHNVVVIDAGGTMTGIHTGTAVITVSSAENSKYTAKCRVTVKPYIPVTGIRISPDTLTVDDGTKGKLTATVLPANASVKDHSWKVGDESVIKMDSAGNYVALKPGSTTVTATTKEGNFSATCRINVKPVAVKGISIQKTMNLGIGEIRTPVWRMNPLNATNKNIIWSSENPKVATVDKQGRITGRSLGTTKIRAKTEEGGFYDICTVTVESYVQDLILDENVFTMTLGKSRKMKLEVVPKNPTRKNLVWKSKDKSVIQVSKNGKLTAVRTGTAEVIVYDRYSGAYDTCIVTVEANLKKPKLIGKFQKKNYILSWKKVDRATNYYLYEYNKKQKKYNKIKAFSGKPRKYTVKKASKGTKYKLRAYYKPNDEYSSYSTEVKVK